MRGMRAIVIALTSAVGLGVAAPAAIAQTYVVESCRAGGQPASMSAWTATASGTSNGTGIADRCADGGVAESM